MAKVQTVKGIIDRSLLTAKDVVTEEETSRVIATEWYLDGEMVRRDVWVSVLVGQSLVGEQGG